METWLILGISAYLFYAVSSAIDEYFMNNGHHETSVTTMKMFFNGAILLIIGSLFFGLSFPPRLIILALVMGGMYALMAALYFKLLKLEDVGKVVPLLHSTTIVLSFVGSVLLFGEKAAGLNFLGLGFVLLGIFVLLSKKGLSLPKWNKSMVFILAEGIVHAAYLLLAKKVLSDFEPTSLAVAMYFSSALFLFGYVLLSKSRRKCFRLKSSKIAVSALFGAIGTLLLYFALEEGSASRVYALMGLQSVFVFGIAALFLKEKFTWAKLAGIAVVFFGLFLVSWTK